MAYKIEISKDGNSGEICPVCRGSEIQQKPERSASIGTGLFVPCLCNSCGFEGTKVYNLEFDCFLSARGDVIREEKRGEGKK